MDVPLIMGIPTSHATRPYSVGWFFTKSGRYTVKSGYMVAQQASEDANPVFFGPDTRRLQVDGAWKESENRAGLGWYYFNTNTPGKLMGGCNLRRGISPLQAELEALIWAMQCMLRTGKLRMVFQTDCSDVVKMVSKPEE
ncbi:unnamed protein product [Microthlaspi erraticum]|uniref:RNase H type-1 domain-containing protein n=1 Tax=Microthlaspi erraticum TaxID=1685480 RepID=A0A6D2IPV2_9BRAS|nr:unnamed protein product [Microthlaspi erraticum]